MPLPYAYTYPCTVQLRRRVVKLASPFHLLNASVMHGAAAECLMHGAAHASQRAAPCPAPPRLAVNVYVGAPSVGPCAQLIVQVPLER